jgi:hypothetical protein
MPNPEPSTEPMVTVQLTRVELAGALTSVNAVADSAPESAPIPLTTVAKKFAAALDTLEDSNG